MFPRRFMHSCTPISPHTIFPRPLPPPPSWWLRDRYSPDEQSPGYQKSPSSPPANLGSPKQSNATDMDWQEKLPEDLKTRRNLGVLQSCLRYLHRWKIHWPIDESTLPNSSPVQYLEALLSPICEIFNQLHSESVLQKAPMRLIQFTSDDSMQAFSFAADEDFERLTVTPPVVLLLRQNMFDRSGSVTWELRNSLSAVFVQSSSVSSVIITNLQDIVVFFPPKPHKQSLNLGTFERIEHTQFPLALRTLVAAYLNESLPFGKFLVIPNIHCKYDKSLISPEGPPQNLDPGTLLTDEHVFQTCRRYSNFDLTTLIRDQSRAMQFFRWKEHIIKHKSKLVARPGDLLTALTNDSGLQFGPSLRPLSPFDPSELPADTTMHIQETRRNCPLAISGISDLLVQSKQFSVKVEDVIAEGTERGICTVYHCILTTIDGDPVSSPPLCLKLFDGAFQSLTMPTNEDIEDDLDLVGWFDQLAYADVYASNEASAYEKLRVIQGSIVPWFYGLHNFTMPDGTALHGLLMEYINGRSLDSVAGEMSTEKLTSLVKSCRQAARVLDLADINQRDWHTGQVLHTNSTTDITHAVFVDFASASQSWEIENLSLPDNYSELLRILLRQFCTSRWDTKIVWEHMGGPDDWGPVHASFPVDGGFKLVHAPNLFPYIVTPDPLTIIQ
ncbi:hypothetical protein NP233_g11131 [Leucocoprinus birnbaumii]|uniref:Protein kinase domain-containing protein n=1 Tax=Leucocoprinus birnbaumii TaxID=56174 RepID=A0AAD5VHM3_9AGAR|nr:hypothetical protein NP233_g11131 [Leucocoprinus birnbaumii]